MSTIKEIYDTKTKLYQKKNREHDKQQELMKLKRIGMLRVISNDMRMSFENWALHDSSKSFTFSLDVYNLSIQELQSISFKDLFDIFETIAPQGTKEHVWISMDDGTHKLQVSLHLVEDNEYYRESYTHSW